MRSTRTGHRRVVTMGDHSARKNGMSKRPFQIALTHEERSILLCALYHWEHYFRGARLARKKAGEDITETELGLNKVRNLKKRAFRMRRTA